MKKKSDQPHSILLVSAPWPLHNRPSIQLGALKAYLLSRSQDISVTAHHFYLHVAEAIGYGQYEALAERTWLAESIYSALLYPQKKASAEKIFYEETRNISLLRNTDFNSLIRRVEKISTEFIKSVKWNNFFLAGFSVCLCQMTSSLYFIRQIKKKHPSLPVVIGEISITPPDGPVVTVMPPVIG